MSKVKFEQIFGAMAVLLGIGFVMSKTAEAKQAMNEKPEEELPPVDIIEPDGLGSLQISQSGGLQPNEMRVIGTFKPYPVDIRWIKNVWDYRNIYIAAYKVGTQFPGYVRVNENGTIQLNNAHAYVGGNLGSRISATAKTAGLYRLIIKQYTGPNAWATRIYEFRG